MGRARSSSAPWLKPTARHSICRKRNRNWSQGSWSGIWLHAIPCCSMATVISLAIFPDVVRLDGRWCSLAAGCRPFRGLPDGFHWMSVYQDGVLLLHVRHGGRPSCPATATPAKKRIGWKCVPALLVLCSGWFPGGVILQNFSKVVRRLLLGARGDWRVFKNGCSIGGTPVKYAG